MTTENVTVFNHPLIQHKISLLRDKNTDTNEFRRRVEEIAMLEGFEALSDLPLEDREVETPIEKCTTPVLAGRKLVLAPILRAGLGMVPGMLALVPSASIIQVYAVTKMSPLANDLFFFLIFSQN